MSDHELLPVRIIWNGPDGSQVVLDEDGVNVRVPNAIEECDVDRLLRIIAVAKEAKAGRFSKTPAPPTRDQLDQWSRGNQARYLAKRAAAYIANGGHEPRAGEVPF